MKRKNEAMETYEAALRGDQDSRIATTTWRCYAKTQAAEGSYFHHFGEGTATVGLEADERGIAMAVGAEVCAAYLQSSTGRS